MAATCEQAEYSVEIHFAQRLAANEKKIRDRAVKRLRQWIAARSRKDTGFGEAELMKLWKGLFYCMWMCDKPVIQEELADEIADMAHCFQQPKQAVTFYDTFLLTMKREWMGIDHLRMDKYLMLVRRSFRQMLVLLHNSEWEEELLELFLNALRRSALNPSVDACPDGLRYHIANVYLDELAREGTEELTPHQASMFLVPFAELAAKTLNKKLRDVILEDIFQDVVERSDVGEAEKEEEEEDEGIASDEDRTKKQKTKKGAKKRKRRRGDDEDDGDEEEDDEEEEDVDILEKVMFPEEMVPPLEYDYGCIAEKLFELASEKSIPPRNRKPIYRMVQRFQSLAKGVYPMPNLLEEIRNERDNEYLKDELPWWKKLQAREKQKKRRRKRRRGKKGGKVADGDGDEEEAEDEDEVVEKKRKKMVDGGEVEETNVDREATGKKKKKGKKIKAKDVDGDEEVVEKKRKKTAEPNDDGNDVAVETTGKKKKGKKLGAREDQNAKATERISVGRNSALPARDSETSTDGGRSGDVSVATPGKTKGKKKKRSAESIRNEGEVEETNVDAANHAEVKVAGKKKRKAKKNKAKEEREDDTTDGMEDGEDSGLSERDTEATRGNADDSSLTTPGKRKGKKKFPARIVGSDDKGTVRMQTASPSSKKGGDRLTPSVDLAITGSTRKQRTKKGTETPDDTSVDKPGLKNAVSDITSPIEGGVVLNEISPTIAKRKKKGMKDDHDNDESAGTVAPGKKESLEISLTGTPDGASGSKVKGGSGKAVSTAPFASFQNVETPPAYVKKSRSKGAGEPSTLPRAKAKSRPETQFTPPMTRKRVKIALSRNESQAAHDYKKRVKLSPGVPFDGSKKPTHSVLKQTPQRSGVDRTKVKGSAKGSAKAGKRRAKATDFF